MVDANETYARFPLTSEGLREGYERTSAEYERQGELGKASRAAFRPLAGLPLAPSANGQKFLASVPTEGSTSPRHDLDELDGRHRQVARVLQAPLERVLADRAHVLEVAKVPDLKNGASE